MRNTRDLNSSTIVIEENPMSHFDDEMDMLDSSFNKKMMTMSFIPNIDKSIEVLTAGRQSSRL